MKIPTNSHWKRRQSGFSVIELMVVIVIVTIVLASILTQLEQVQQRATAEQGKVDEFQQARDFFDQMYNDTRQIGYPNLRNFDTSAWSTAPASPPRNDHRMAMGLVKLTATEMDFEGDVDGSGNVSLVSYALNGSGTCSGCLQRAQLTKTANGDSVTALSGLTYNTEVQNVTNSVVFTPYDSTGAAVTGMPFDADSNATKIASVRTIEVVIRVANPQSKDPKTGQTLEADFKGRVQIANCSMATTSQTWTCN